jgi:hypothetical protein
VNRANHLGVVDPLQVDGSHPEVGMTKLALDHVERHALASHLYGVRVAQLVRREPAPDAGGDRKMTKLLPGSRSRPSRPRVRPLAIQKSGPTGI